MYTDTTPVFSNTCGKIYKDHVVLASSTKESDFSYMEIKNFTFNQRLDAKALLFACLPGVLLAFPFMFTREEMVIRVAFGIVGFLGVALCLFKAQKKYTINLETTQGRVVKVKVWHGNKKEAEKFVAKALPLMEKAKKAPETGYTINGAMTEVLS